MDPTALLVLVAFAFGFAVGYGVREWRSRKRRRRYGYLRETVGEQSAKKSPTRFAADLNFDNPQVLRAMLGVMRYWLQLGVDGLRLGAVPYLVEREGTSNENLPETHQILKRFRAELDATFPDRMLLAEVNQWPEDVKEYFGEGDECHMAFHFPLMPRMYMAIAREDRFPISDILRQTPPIPAT